MHNLIDLPSDLVGLCSAAQRSLAVGDFGDVSTRLVPCLAAFQSKTRVLDDVQAYLDWLNECLQVAHISRKHLSHQLMQLQRLDYGRVETAPIWSVQG